MQGWFFVLMSVHTGQYNYILHEQKTFRKYAELPSNSCLKLMVIVLLFPCSLCPSLKNLYN